MGRHVFVVFSEPAEDQEEEYNDWYSNTHIHDLLKIPGLVRASRYVLSEGVVSSTGPNASPSAPSGQKYLALYEIEADDVSYVPDAIMELGRSGQMPLHPALSNVNRGYFTMISSTDPTFDPNS
jgi:hypothetical protein